MSTLWSPPSPQALAAAIDHTQLSPFATADDIGRLCDEAVAHGLGCVCVSPRHVARAAQRLREHPVAVCTVVGFPHGAHTTASKVFETTAAIADGADEIDMVLALGALREGDDAAVRRDVARVVEAARGRCVKVIVESATAVGDELERSCSLCLEAGASFVKTSTGFGGGGASVEAVARMRAAVGPDVGVKASGGIRDTATALAMLEAGANRLGLSRSLEIVAGLS